MMQPTISRMARAAALLLCCYPAAWAQQPPAAPAASGPWRLADAVNTPGWLSLSGSIRPRYESLSEAFTAGRTGSDQLFGVQSLLGAEARTGDFAFGGEILDARIIAGDNGGSASAEGDALELLQAYAAWRPTSIFVPGGDLEILAGRFTMDIGSRRLVSRSGFRHVLASHEGVRATFTSSSGFGATVFAATPLSREPNDVASLLDNEVALNSAPDDVLFAGGQIQTPLFSGLTGEIYAFDLDESDDASHPSRNRDLLTTGVRVSRKPASGKLDLDLEWAKQTGSSRASTSALDTTDLDHDADMLHAEIGYTFAASWSPRLALQYDAASGDRSPLDAENNRFDPLFGDRRFEFGPTSIFGAVARTNLSSPGVRLEVKPSARWDGFIAIRGVDLDEPRDSLGGTGVRDASGASGDEAGIMAEVRARYWVIPRSLRLELGAAVLGRGDFLKSAPNAAASEDPVYGYMQWTFDY